MKKNDNVMTDFILIKNEVTKILRSRCKCYHHELPGQIAEALVAKGFIYGPPNGGKMK